MKFRPGLAIASLALLTVAPRWALAEDAAAAYKPCVACHGEAAQGNAALGAPALAAQDETYLVRQLTHFKTGIRGGDPRDTGGAQMQAMAAPLSGDDIAGLAAYLSGLSRGTPEDVLSGDLKTGNNYYQGNCGACHGSSAQGNPAFNSPALAGLGAAYLKRQYRNFAEGVRGAHPDDKYGGQMKLMSQSLPNEQVLDDVIAYIQTLGSER